MDALRLTDMAMEKRNARDMFRPGIEIILDPRLSTIVYSIRLSFGIVSLNIVSLVRLYYGLPNGINEEISRRSQITPQRPKYSKKDFHKMGSQFDLPTMSMFYQ